MASPPDQELEELRREVDRIDRAMVELLAERLRVVREIARIKQTAAAGRPAIRPGPRGGDPAPPGRAGRRPASRPATLVRMWRELLAATTRAQAPLAIAACVPPDRPELWDLARDHFGSAVADPAHRQLVARAAAGRRRRRRSRRAAAAGRARALVGEPAGHLGPAAAGRGPAAVRPGWRRISKAAAPWWSARSSPSRPAPTSACSRSRRRPRSAARGCSTLWRRPICAPRVLATLAPARGRHGAAPDRAGRLRHAAAIRRLAQAPGPGARSWSCAACGSAAMPVPWPPATDARRFAAQQPR